MKSKASFTEMTPEELRHQYPVADGCACFGRINRGTGLSPDYLKLI